MPDFHDLRPYQHRAAFAVQEAWQEHKRVLVCHAVGTGKTHLGAYLLARWEQSRLYEEFKLPQRRLWLAYTDEQIDQAVSAIEYWVGETPAIEKAGRSIRREPSMLGAGIVVSSVQTLMRPDRLNYFRPQEFGMLVVDECAHIVCAGIQPILEHFDQAKLVGLTATPRRSDEVPLGQIFDSVADHYSLVEGIMDGWLCRLRLRVVEVQAVDWSAALAASELDEDRVAAIIEEEGEALHAICRAIVDYNEGRPTVIYAPRVLAAEAICNLLASRYAPGAVCEVVSGTTDDDQRRDIVARFREGKVAYLSNCGIFCEGTDLRNLGCIVLARKVQSRMLFEQIVGRGMRGGPLDPVPGKNDGCLLIDLMGGGRHKLTTAVDLLGGKWEQCVRDEAYAQVYEQKHEVPVDVMEAVLTAKAQTEQLRINERRKIVADIKAKVSTVDPFELFPEAAADTGVVPTWWDGRLATEDQVDRLKKLGIPSKGLTWLEGEKLLRAASSRRAAGLCSYKQARFLRMNGLDTSMPATEAHDVMACLAREGFRPGPASFRRAAVAKKRGRPLSFAEMPMQYRVRGGTACQVRQVGQTAWSDFVTRRDSQFGHPAGREGSCAIFQQGAYELKIEPKSYFVTIGVAKTGGRPPRKGALR